MLYSIISLLIKGVIYYAGVQESSQKAGQADSERGSCSRSTFIAACTFAGQNLGAKNYERLRKGALRIPLFSGIVTCTAGLIFTSICRPILDLFTNDPEVLELSVRYIHVVLPFTWMYAVFNGIICFVNGAGEVKYPTVVNILMLWAVRIPAAFLIARYLHGQLVMASVPISFCFGMLCMLALYRTRKWKGILQGEVR